LWLVAARLLLSGLSGLPGLTLLRRLNRLSGLCRRCLLLSRRRFLCWRYGSFLLWLLGEHRCGQQ
jgi:hypothetical protein